MQKQSYNSSFSKISIKIQKTEEFLKYYLDYLS